MSDSNPAQGKENDSSSATFLLTGMPLYQRIVTGPAWLVFLKMAIPGSLLILLSFPVGIASIPSVHDTGFAQNLGLLYRANWTWGYAVIWPIAIILFRRLSDNLRSSIVDLEQMKVLVPHATGEQQFVTYLESRLTTSGRPILLWTIVGVIIFTLLDTLDLTRGYFSYARSSLDACNYIFSEFDWSVAFAVQCWSGVVAGTEYVPPSILTNGIFVILAYFVQCLMIVSFVVFFLRLAQFFFVFASSLKGDAFKLDPWLDDPMRRLGLGSLGRSYNLFLTLILIFESYVALHRLQQVALREGLSVVSYIRDLILVSSQPSRWLDPEIHAFDSADIGTITLIVAIVLPLTLVCWFPLFQLRTYIQDRKLELSKEWAMKRTEADMQGNVAEVARYEKQGRQLDAANIWPNGDAAAQRFILAMALLWLGSVFPVVFVSAALGAFGLLELIRFIVWLWDRKHKSADAGALS